MCTHVTGPHRPVVEAGQEESTEETMGHNDGILPTETCTVHTSGKSGGEGAG